MCDTILATPASTAERFMLFGKNSDRYRNEAQAVELHPRATHPAGSQLRCTYICIPQVHATHAVLICRPFWIWGAEMGANEHGVVIGNEGLQARSPAPQEEALIGMDLLRLALERAQSAAEAVQIIASLLEQFGQGGNCGHLKAAYYNNGFMIADADEAFVMETIGREWLVERVRNTRAMSNIYSIHGDPERSSRGLRSLLQQFGGGETADYAQTISHPDSQHIGQSGARWERSAQLLQASDGNLRTEHMIAILRDHHAHEHTQLEWHERIEARRTLCLHAGPENVGAQTTGSMVSEVALDRKVHWVTGTAAPCISIFKPVFLECELPAPGPALTDQFDPATLWWKHERMHRLALMGDFAQFVRDISEERDALESKFRARVADVQRGGSVADRTHVVRACWQEAMDAESRWLSRIRPTGGSKDTSFHRAWMKMSNVANLPL